jgi:hypothetical protein
MGARSLSLFLRVKRLARRPAIKPNLHLDSPIADSKGRHAPSSRVDAQPHRGVTGRVTNEIRRT